MCYLSLVLFLDKEIKFQPSVWNCCHGVSMISIDLNHFAILIIFSADYISIINGISKSERMNLLKNVELNENGGT